MEQDWMDFFNRHKGKLLGICIGLAFGWFAITYGFWKAVFVALCIAAGYLVGKRLDERVDWARLWDRLFRKD